ncbi:hypothetical protein GDO78_021914 [Eleutherodactylus coqui]|uniref:Uncharacterized protein n=1 Tax=Eleutherodactylus coqui TaxID=57060 RepID=A0A8J6E2R2_ELECQ|nr:hypothetical protein GDO78_021914 [Eleutherodactylus coqui]
MAVLGCVSTHYEYVCSSLIITHLHEVALTLLWESNSGVLKPQHLWNISNVLMKTFYFRVSYIIWGLKRGDFQEKHDDPQRCSVDRVGGLDTGGSTDVTQIRHAAGRTR